MVERKKRRFEPVGPYAPPTPDEADGDAADAVPMAVAQDKATWHDAFMPTSSSKDAYVQMEGQPSKERMMAKGNAETRRAQRPDPRRPVDSQGFRDPLEEEEESGDE